MAFRRSSVRSRSAPPFTLGGSIKKVVSLAVLIFAFVFSSGCPIVLVGAGFGAGVGTYLYLEGDLTRVYPVAYSKAWDATKYST
ncbi:MAG TPA: hypothetical protein DEP99_01560 [Nitrospiraceae bacterium]|nr:hypothetical protein [Nitrospiraceae bacterium]